MAGSKNQSIIREQATQEPVQTLHKDPKAIVSDDTYMRSVQELLAPFLSFQTTAVLLGNAYQGPASPHIQPTFNVGYCCTQIQMALPGQTLLPGYNDKGVAPITQLLLLQNT